MLLANYGSDSDNDSDEDNQARPPPPIRPPAVSATAGPSRPVQSPAPAPAPAAKPKRKGPVKITLDLPKSSIPGSGAGEANLEEDEGPGAVDDEGVEGARGGAKRVKLGGGGLKGGKGSSSLLGMLPAPKRKLPKASFKAPLAVNRAMAAPSKPKPAPNLPAPPGFQGASEDDDDDEDGEAGGLLIPANVKRKAAAEPELDLFGLASTPAASSSKPATPKPLISSSAAISSAPVVADFVPPVPTLQDPYPGYYQLPSGTWEAYDPEYYHSFFPASSTSASGSGAGAGDGSGAGEVEVDDGRLGRHWKQFEERGADVVDVNINKDLEAARAEEERKARMVKPSTSGDGYEYKTIGQVKGLAQERHQLTSLLNTAFTQRDELEQRIALNKKNMRIAGQKYGF